MRIDDLHPTPEMERVSPNCFVSLGPIASALIHLGRRHEMSHEMEMYPEFAPDTTEQEECERIALIQSYGITTGFWGRLLRSRVGGNWLNENHHWAMTLEYDVMVDVSDGVIILPNPEEVAMRARVSRGDA